MMLNLYLWVTVGLWLGNIVPAARRIGRGDSDNRTLDLFCVIVGCAMLAWALLLIRK